MTRTASIFAALFLAYMIGMFVLIAWGAGTIIPKLLGE